jgi:hypothetical protein
MPRAPDQMFCEQLRPGGSRIIVELIKQFAVDGCIGSNRQGLSDCFDGFSMPGLFTQKARQIDPRKRIFRIELDTVSVMGFSLVTSTQPFEHISKIRMYAGGIFASREPQTAFERNQRLR